MIALVGRSDPEPRLDWPRSGDANDVKEGGGRHPWEAVIWDHERKQTYHGLKEGEGSSEMASRAS